MNDISETIDNNTCKRTFPLSGQLPNQPIMCFSPQRLCQNLLFYHQNIDTVYKMFTYSKLHAYRQNNKIGYQWASALGSGSAKVWCKSLGLPWFIPYSQLGPLASNCTYLLDAGVDTNVQHLLSGYFSCSRQCLGQQSASISQFTLPSWQASIFHPVCVIYRITAISHFVLDLA